MDEGCKGCHTGSICKLLIEKSLCPCMNCIVKPMCIIACTTYANAATELFKEYRLGKRIPGGDKC